jgi:hypothetical protein
MLGIFFCFLILFLVQFNTVDFFPNITFVFSVLCQIPERKSLKEGMIYLGFWFQRFQSVMTERHDGTKLLTSWQPGNLEKERVIENKCDREREREKMNEGSVTRVPSKTHHIDLHSPVKVHLLKFPQIALQTGDRVFNTLARGEHFRYKLLTSFFSIPLFFFFLSFMSIFTFFTFFHTFFSILLISYIPSWT